MAATQVPFQSVVDALLDSKPFPAAYLQFFSDMDPRSLKLLMEAWPQVDANRKYSLLKDLEALAEENTLVSFEELGRSLLNDADPIVRAGAIRLLNETDDPKLVPVYIDMMNSDENEDVRAEAAGALGEYVILGELEELAPKFLQASEAALLQKANGEDKSSVRRRALESLGFSSRPEVITLIESAIKRQDPEWKASALVAMGRSNDDRWQDLVIQMLLHEDPVVRLAAVDAAGDLALAPARLILIGLLDEEEDDDIISSAIWSLSQIGGEDARVLLESLASEAEDEELLAFLEDALENLAFTEDMERFDLLSFDPEDENPEE
ncbi:MAG TPA: HEAT repeat domain-containing protein [Anaerolineales bacterium]